MPTKRSQVSGQLQLLCVTWIKTKNKEDSHKNYEREFCRVETAKANMLLMYIHMRTVENQHGWVEQRGKVSDNCSIYIVHHELIYLQKEHRS